jgi:hypothetical protein
LFGILAAFANRIGNFARFTKTDSDTAMLVSYNNQRAKAKAASTFNDLRRTINEDDLFR